VQKLMPRHAFAGDFRPAHVPHDCLVAKTAGQYGFSPFVVSVGTTYFQRICSADPALRRVSTPFLSAFYSSFRQTPPPPPPECLPGSLPPSLPSR